MSAASGWLEAGAFGAPYPYVALATLAWFALIYAVIAGGTYLLAIDHLPETLHDGGRIQRMRPRQVRDEIILSLLSMLIFGAQAIGLVWALRNGWLDVGWDRSAWHLLWEMPLLYLWNELRFFAVHRLLHWPPLYRTIHIRHHRSVITTPFSAYSFHPVESFLLGTVMPLALVFHAFSPLALIGLTIMSLALNVSAHLPHEHVRPAFAFAVPHARHHNEHHRRFNTHFGFSLRALDRWFTRAPRVDENIRG